MSSILLILRILSAAGIAMPQFISLIEKFGPTLESIIKAGENIGELFKMIAKLFQGFVKEGGDPSIAADRAFSIGLKLTPATTEEMEKIKRMGFPPDAMHDFEQATSG